MVQKFWKSKCAVDINFDSPPINSSSCAFTSVRWAIINNSCGILCGKQLNTIDTRNVSSCGEFGTLMLIWFIFYVVCGFVPMHMLIGGSAKNRTRQQITCDNLHRFFCYDVFSNVKFEDNTFVQMMSSGGKKSNILSKRCNSLWHMQAYGYLDAYDIG